MQTIIRILIQIYFHSAIETENSFMSKRKCRNNYEFKKKDRQELTPAGNEIFSFCLMKWKQR